MVRNVEVAPGSARLVLLRGIGAPGSSWQLQDEQTQAGRAIGALRFAADDTLSALAATFMYRDGSLLVRDEHGPSGVFVRLAEPTILKPDAWFSIGDKLLRFLGKVPAPPSSAAGPLLLGSPRPGNKPLLRIQVFHLGGVGGRVYARTGPMRLGRAIGDVLFTDDPFVSARHCELDMDPAGALLRDLGSSNGTFIRLPPGSERALQPGDTLRLGRNILRIE